MLEPNEKDRRKLKAKMPYFIKTFEFIQSRNNKLNAEASAKPAEKLKQGLSELEQLIAFTIYLMHEDDPLS